MCNLILVDEFVYDIDIIRILLMINLIALVLIYMGSQELKPMVTLC